MEQPENGIKSLSTINLILGIWFIISPYILGYTATAAKWNQVVVGIIIGLLAIWRMLAPTQRWTSIVAGIAGLWAIIAPFILSYNTSAAYWNEIVVAIVVAYVAFANGALPAGNRTQHHGV